ncbi:hypothetical protein WJX84_008056 [Apatococcus fuscideae]|uniref:Expansin-like EG45 domain-containing protein n=1 Tax=Apatococcus fuscideae TaxID=2026836 RepID=A0AAW1SSQ6_9CHLO
MPQQDSMVASLPLGLIALCCVLPTAFGQFSWATFTNAAAPQSGKATYYGPGGDAQGTCSWGPNFANTLGLPATANAATTIALNDVDFSAGLACGMCVMFIGTGGGIGTTPISTTTWTLGQVTNRCPECAKGSIDINSGGDGIWAEQWYAVDCNVGSSSMTYSVVQGSQYYFEMVVSNARNPIIGVSAEINGAWLPLTRTTNNQWAYYNSQGPYSFPMAHPDHMRERGHRTGYHVDAGAKEQAFLAASSLDSIVASLLPSLRKS